MHLTLIICINTTFLKDLRTCGEETVDEHEDKVETIIAVSV